MGIDQHIGFIGLLVATTCPGAVYAMREMSLKLSPYKWLAVSGGRAQFTHRTVCQITGLSSDTVLNWVTRGVVASERPGSGVWRRYCGQELIVFALAGKLVQLGLGARDSARIASQIWLDLRKHLNRAGRGRLRRFSDLSDAIAHVWSAAAGEPQNVRVKFGLNRLSKADIGHDSPLIVFACGRLISNIIAKACEHLAEPIETGQKRN